MRVYKWEKEFLVSLELPKNSNNNPAKLFNRYIVPALYALDNQYEHEKKNRPNIVKLNTRAEMGDIFDDQKEIDTLVIYLKIVEVDEDATEIKIRDFLKTINCAVA